MLSPASELLLRNKHFFETGNWLIINATDGEIFSYFKQQVIGYHQFYHDYLSISSYAKGKHIYASYEALENKFDGVIVYWPKSKQHGLMLCQFAVTHLVDNGFLLIVGDNKGGVKSAGKLLDKSGIHTQKSDSARHCTLLAAQISTPVLNFDPSSQIHTYQLTNNAQPLSLQILPGAFSCDGIDPGSALLLADIDALLSDMSDHNKRSKQPLKILDFACGNGVIGLSVAQGLSPQMIARSVAYELTLSDVNAIALSCAQNNIRLNQFDAQQIKVVSSDGLQQVSEKFHLIVSNPPFHSGTKTDYSISEQFFRDAKQKLLPGGKLRIVANRFLKYPDQLESVFGNLKIITKNSKFSVYQCSNS